MKLLSSRPDGSVILQYIFTQFDRALFHGTFHRYHPIKVFCTLYESSDKNMTVKAIPHMGGMARRITLPAVRGT